MNVDIEYGNASPAGIHRRLELAFRGAPPEIRRSVGLPPYPGKASRQATPPQSRRAAKPAQRYIGWLAGTLAPFVSTPVHSPRDGETLHEQFSDRAWSTILEQVESGKRQVKLQLRHGGPVVATAPGKLRFRLHSAPFVGLCWEARLAEGALADKIFEALAAGGLGVSAGFGCRNSWHVHRQGVGKVRVVDDIVLDHVALIPLGGQERAAFAGARAYGQRSEDSRCPAQLRTDAEQFAWTEIRRQLGAPL